jgi:hypothetical protein
MNEWTIMKDMFNQSNKNLHKPYEWNKQKP